MTKKKFFLILLLNITLLLGFGVSSNWASTGFRLSGAGTGVKTPGESSTRASGNVTITFEGIPDNTPVGTQSGVAFASAWNAVVDADAGGSGNFANEPSPDTAALPVGAVTQNQTRITLPEVTNEVNFYYTLNTLAASSVAVYFYDKNGGLLGTKQMDVCGATLCGNNCTGDPNGSFCSWVPLTATYSGIQYVEFQLAGLGSWGIDNFRYVSATIPTLSEWGMMILMVSLLLATLWMIRRRPTRSS